MGRRVVIISSILMILILLFVSAYFILSNGGSGSLGSDIPNKICRLSYDCNSLNSLSNVEKIKCDFKKVSNKPGGLVPSIRLQGELSDIWDQNKPTVRELVDEIICKNNPDEFRSYMASVLRNYAARTDKKWTKADLFAEEEVLLLFIKDKTQNGTLRGKVISELSRTYYYLGFNEAESNNLFLTTVSLLDEGDEVAVYAVDALRSSNTISLDKKVRTLKEFIIKKYNLKSSPMAYNSALYSLLASGDQDVIDLARELCGSGEITNQVICNNAKVKK